jgi:hypothetical protein
MITNERDDADLWYAIAWGVLLVIATAIRFRFLGTTLFEDEVWVAELVRRGGMHPHSYNAPPLFYGIERAWIAFRGFSDVALREPPAFFGVALCAVPLFAPLPRISRFVWGTLLAFSSPLIFYSERLKQYTIEAFFTAVLLVLFLRFRQKRSALTIFLFFVVAAAAVLTLHSTIFLLVAMALISIRQPRLLGLFALVFVLWGVAYVGWLKPGAETVRLHGDMTQWFTVTGRWVTSPSLFVTNTLHWTGQALNLVRFWWLAVPLLIVIWLARERNVVLLLLAVLPPLEVAAASAFHIYPYGEVRLLIFCFPALFLLLAESLAVSARRVPILLLLMAPFVINGVARDTYNATYMHIYDLRPMFDAIVHSHLPGEPVYADPSFDPVLRYHYPSLAPDIHGGTMNLVAAPGWYIQRGSTFSTAGASTVMHIGDVTAARKAGGWR